MSTLRLIIDITSPSEVVNSAYGACVRAAKALGYKKVITYTLTSETGASLKASNFISEGEAGGNRMLP